VKEQVFSGHKRAAGFYTEGSDLLLFRRVVIDDETVGTVFVRSDMPDVAVRLRGYGAL
jgi:hypothetical protein